jgi:serine/threonine protein kinase
MDAYNVVELVGEGSFGKVYKARRRFTGQIVVRLQEQCMQLEHVVGLPCLHALTTLFFLLPLCVCSCPRTPGARQAIKFIMKHGKSEKDIRALRQEIEILRSLQARPVNHAAPSAPVT